MRPIAKRLVSVRPSRFLMCLLWLVHFVAVWIVLSAKIPSLWQGALVLLIGASWVKHAGTASVEQSTLTNTTITKSIIAKSTSAKNTATLILHGDGRIEKLGAGDTVSEVVLHPHTTGLPFLVILLYREKKRLQSLVLLKDSLETEDFRQLRLWLRWQIKQLSSSYNK